MSLDPWELLREARESVVALADEYDSLMLAPETEEKQRELARRIDAALAEHESATPVVEWAYDVGNTQKASFLDMELVVLPRALHHLFKWSVTLTRNKVHYNTHGYTNTEAEAKAAAIAAARGLR
jgi:hypothetical protein